MRRESQSDVRPLKVVMQKVNIGNNFPHCDVMQSFSTLLQNGVKFLRKSKPGCKKETVATMIVHNIHGEEIYSWFYHQRSVWSISLLKYCNVPAHLAQLQYFYFYF